MPLFTYQNLEQTQKTFFNSMDSMIKTASQEHKLHTEFDVFLSHSYKNKKLALEVREKFHTYGITAYVDWIEDPELDRSKVNRKTAGLLRERMKQCKSLAFLDTEDALESTWTPWEVGFADADKQRVFIIPIRQNEVSYRNYIGQEFFSLYPFLDEEPNTKDHQNTLWINSPYQEEHYDTFQYWLKYGEPFHNHTNN